MNHPTTRLIAAFLVAPLLMGACASGPAPPGPRAQAGAAEEVPAGADAVPCDASRDAVRSGMIGLLLGGLLGAAEGARVAAYHGAGVGEAAWIGAAAGAGIGLVIGFISGWQKARESGASYAAAPSPCTEKPTATDHVATVTAAPRPD